MLRPAALIPALALLGTLAGCGSSSDGATSPFPAPVVPPLESVPFSFLGSGKVAFERISSVTGYDAIYLIDATAMTSSHSFDNGVNFGATLSPDGRRLAYTAYTDVNTAYDVYVANSDGTGVQQATSFPQQEGPPSWTPDGAKIIVPGGNGNFVYNVYSQSPVANPADRTQLTHFTAPSPGAAFSCPTIIDNETRVAASAQGMLAFACFNGEIDILASSGALSATYFPLRNDRRHWTNVLAPSWSPDGTRVAFMETTSDSATNYSVIGLAVKVMNADGSNVATVTSVAAASSGGIGGGWLGSNNYSLCWMPDGSRLVFNIPESMLIGHLWVVRADGTGLAQLTSAPGVWDRSVSCAR